MNFKRILSFLIVTCISVTVNGIDYKKFLQKHDVDQETMSLKSNNPLDFWNSLKSNSEHLQEFLEEINSDKGKAVGKIMAKMPRFNPRFRPEVLTDSFNICSDIAKVLGESSDIEICIVDDDQFNAFATYSDNGMVVAIHSGVFSARGVTPEIIFGLVAHEYAHCMLSHILQQEVANDKRNLRNKVITGIGAGLAVIGAGAEAYTSSQLGIEYDPDKYSDMLESLERSSNKDLYKFIHRYSRELEFEADLVAYRFMEWAGYGGDRYIEVLQLIEAVDPTGHLWTVEGEGDTHPTHRNRIEFLKFAKDHPEISNTLNQKIKKKKEYKKSYPFEDIYN